MSALYVKSYCRTGYSIPVLVTAALVISLSVNNNDADEETHDLMIFDTESILNVFLLVCFVCLCV